MNADAAGYLIRDVAEFYRVTVHELPASTPLQSQSRCPACRLPLVPILALVARKGMQTLRVGACDDCGYAGYMARPSDEWVADFYSHTWDRHTAYTAEWVRNQHPLLSEHKMIRKNAASIAAELSLDVSRSALEIGCGYGNVLRYFRDDIGMAGVMGVEHSPHRAAAVSEGFGIPVAVGAFESDPVQTQVRAGAPYSLIFSHHVFEHVVDGDAFIAAASKLQNTGDWLILAMPDVAGEHAGYVALYPPHLHSYSKRGIEVMLNRHGYAVRMDRSPSLDKMVLVAQKGGDNKSLFTLSGKGSRHLERKLRQGLGIARVPEKGYALIEWLLPHAGYDDARVSPVSGIGWAARKVMWRAKAVLGRHSSAHAMLVEPLHRRYTDAPLEIQWDGPMKLLFK